MTHGLLNGDMIIVLYHRKALLLNVIIQLVLVLRLQG